MPDAVFFAAVKKSFYTSVSRDLGMDGCLNVIDMNDDIAAMPGQKAGCLVAAHVVVGIHTAYISVLALDRHDRDSKL